MFRQKVILHRLGGAKKFANIFAFSLYAGRSPLKRVRGSQNVTFCPFQSKTNPPKNTVGDIGITVSLQKVGVRLQVSVFSVHQTAAPLMDSSPSLWAGKSKLG